MIPAERQLPAPPDGHTDDGCAMVESSRTAPRSPSPGGRRAWMITALLLVLAMINFGDKAVLGLAATSIRYDLGLSAEQYGLIASGVFMLFSLSALFVGYLADRTSPSRVLLILSVTWALAMLPVLGPIGFGVLLASRIVLGAAEGPAFGVSQQAVATWFEDRDRSLPTAFISVGGALGVVIGAPALTWLIIHHGWRSAFVALAVVGLAWSAVWLVVGRDGPVGTVAAATRVRPTHDDDTRASLWTILSSRTWLGCTVGGFVGYCSIA